MEEYKIAFKIGNLFSERTEATYEQIKAHVGLPEAQEAELKESLETLVGLGKLTPNSDNTVYRTGIRRGFHLFILFD